MSAVFQRLANAKWLQSVHNIVRAHRNDHHVCFLTRLMSLSRLLGVSAWLRRLKSISSSPSPCNMRSSNSACGRSNSSSGMSMTEIRLFMAASGSCSSPVGVIGPVCVAVLSPSWPVFPWKLSGDDDQVVEDIDGELAAYKDGALLQLAGVAATNGSEIALINSTVSAALANLNSMYPRRSTSSRGA
jgi:hypothetical protein